MDAIKLLKAQHKEVRKYFKDYESAEDAEQKREIFRQVADALAAHATIEEKRFYQAAYVGELQPLLKVAVEEHLAAKRVIADLLQMEPMDGNYDAKMQVLRDEIERHMKEEEGELFVLARRALSKQDLETLGEEMEQLYVKLMEGSPRNEIPSQTEAAAPLS